MVLSFCCDWPHFISGLRNIHYFRLHTNDKLRGLSLAVLSLCDIRVDADSKEIKGKVTNNQWIKGFVTCMILAALWLWFIVTKCVIEWPNPLFLHQEVIKKTLCYTILRDIICLLFCHVNNHLSRNVTRPPETRAPLVLALSQSKPRLGEQYRYATIHTGFVLIHTIQHGIRYIFRKVSKDKGLEFPKILATTSTFLSWRGHCSCQDVATAQTATS